MSNVFEHGKVVSGGISTGTHLVVIEGHIHGPVGTDGVGDALGVGSQIDDAAFQWTPVRKSAYGG